MNNNRLGENGTGPEFVRAHKTHRTTNILQHAKTLDISADEDIFFGINTNIYKRKIDPEVPQSKTGTDFKLLPQNPSFILEPDSYEPMYIPKQDSLENALKREIERFCFADTLLNKVVFDCVDPSPFTKDIDPALYSMEVLPYYIPKSKEDTILVFESRFESGNLRRAIQICEFEYNIILKPDYFTTGNIQWYYFSVSNTRKNQEYRFNIINMMKPDSLYNAGMKPLVYSEKNSKIQKQGWFRDGHDICYYQNNMKKKSGGFYYTLTFAITLQNDYDCVYFAHCYPYTYTQLCKYILDLEKDPNRKNKVKRKTMCQTIAGNNCDVLTITEMNDDRYEENKREKRGIVLTSRVHPGESMASFIIEYVIDFLTGNSFEARILRENFIIKIVPMLNIDGVVNGNYRTNLAGVDLNRQWINPMKNLHPTIYHCKQMIRTLKEEKGLVFYCDFHGHSRKKNTFMYGNTGKDNLKKEMIFPMLMRNNCHIFSFKDCNFGVQKEKEGTSRINLWRELNITNCYTLEVSFCGSDFGKYEYFHFNLDIFRDLAQAFCRSLIDCFEPEQQKVKLIIDEIDMMNKNSDKKDDKNGGDSDGDSDYSNEDKQETNAGGNQPAPSTNGGGANATQIAGDKIGNGNLVMTESSKQPAAGVLKIVNDPVKKIIKKKNPGEKKKK